MKNAGSQTDAVVVLPKPPLPTDFTPDMPKSGSNHGALNSTRSIKKWPSLERKTCADDFDFWEGVSLNRSSVPVLRISRRRSRRDAHDSAPSLQPAAKSHHFASPYKSSSVSSFKSFDHSAAGHVSHGSRSESYPHYHGSARPVFTSHERLLKWPQMANRARHQIIMSGGHRLDGKLKSTSGYESFSHRPLSDQHSSKYKSCSERSPSAECFDNHTRAQVGASKKSFSHRSRNATSQKRSCQYSGTSANASRSKKKKLDNSLTNWPQRYSPHQAVRPFHYTPALWPRVPYYTPYPFNFPSLFSSVPPLFINSAPILPPGSVPWWNAGWRWVTCAGMLC